LRCVTLGNPGHEAVTVTVPVVHPTKLAMTVLVLVCIRTVCLCVNVVEAVPAAVSIVPL
jgi:hypothetical protein